MDDQSLSNQTQRETTHQRTANPSHELIRAVAEKVYFMLQKDLALMRERQRFVPPSANSLKRGWP